MELITSYWPVILVGLIIAVIVGYYLFKPRQRVRLSDNGAPVRPHMAAASDDKIPHISKADPFHTPPPAGAADAEGGDDLLKLKGVGPKFVALLHSHGLHRYEQIASLSPAQVEQLDADMGAFKGRLLRDRVVEQADYLARGDVDGYKAKFGAL